MRYLSWDIRGQCQELNYIISLVGIISIFHLCYYYIVLLLIRIIIIIILHYIISFLILLGGTFQWLGQRLSLIGNEINQIVFLQHHPYRSKFSRSILRYTFIIISIRSISLDNNNNNNILFCCGTSPLVYSRIYLFI